MIFIKEKRPYWVFFLYLYKTRDILMYANTADKSLESALPNEIFFFM
jgi:hypothetical protein